jgi:exodeoxyribonuclease VII large subunit
VVSGIGHETDVTLADLSADLRAATPTAAAEMVAPATAAARQALEAREIAISRRLLGAIEREAQRLDRLTLRLARPGEDVRRRGHRLDLLAERLRSAARREIERGQSRGAASAARLRTALVFARSRAASRLDSAALHLAALDPHRVLARGYAMLADGSGRPVTSVAAMAPGDRLVATVSDGQAGVVVDSLAASPAPS